jgi:uncharacterized protein (TIGR02246 family)
MDKQTQIEIEHDCRALTQAFAYHLDERNYEALAALFAPHGVWIRHGARLEGRAQIIAAMQQRPANQFTRHLTTSMHFTHVNENTARSVAYNLSYFTLEPSELPMRYQPENVMVLDFKDTFTKTAEGWRFLERDTPLTMVSDQVRAVFFAGHE